MLKESLSSWHSQLPLENKGRGWCFHPRPWAAQSVCSLLVPEMEPTCLGLLTSVQCALLHTVLLFLLSLYGTPLKAELRLQWIYKYYSGYRAPRRLNTVLLISQLFWESHIRKSNNMRMKICHVGGKGESLRGSHKHSSHIQSPVRSLASHNPPPFSILLSVVPGHP